ncbi:MAG: tetratricopeptide repeat protein [Nitrospinaceae bacterium]|nr:tetratricopeptide repeat protein [Nitrospinaceae bacterium]NIS85335.1 tetratricopeptide repeat protein [Nitrospinaceae bacterium]NIT82145.1 tetratricopeptide repeat protein [Nitrospinaceae bacterium]NIU44404.1 tetratricopeptide repeat protein [Nitrospinaceae bacterium]NIU96539.1 tetratricopeptide repeat protein [Nitrospinaceae bacterium]
MPVIFLVLTFNRGGDYRSEVVLWETTAAHSPDKARVHYELGRAYLQQEKVDPAEKELARVLELDPKNIPARIMLGKINIERENYSSALESYLALIRQNIKTPAVKFNTGLCYLEMGQAGQALPYLEEAVDKQPGSAYGHFILGRAYHQSRRLNDALKQFRTSVQINPDDPKTHYHMGQVFWDLKSYFFADASFQKAYQLDPQYVDALNNLISSSMLFKQYDQAITYLNRLLEINPDDPNARQLLTAAQRLRDRPAPKVPARPEQFH